MEDWIQSGEDWGRSSISLNAQKSKMQKKRGKYVMKTFKELKTLYGSAAAKTIRENKKNLGPAWWHRHPELPEVEDTCSNITNYACFFRVQSVVVQRQGDKCW